MRRLVLLLFLSAGACAAPVQHQAAPRPPVVVVAPAVAHRATALGLAACASWGKQAAATDLTAVSALRATAERSATAAAKLDPRWAPLASDLADLKAVEAAYATADVNHAYPLAPKLERLRQRIPSYC